LRTYLTLRERFYVPLLFDNIRRYIQCCHLCQSRGSKPEGPDAEHIRIPYDFRPMSRLSIDVKYMPPSTEGYNYILLVCCEFSNYVIGIPLKQITALHLAEALLNRVFWQFGPPKQIISDMDKALTSQLMTDVYGIFGTDLKVVSPGNHGSNRVERYIRTIGDMLNKHMTGQGKGWPKALQPACYAHNTFVTPTVKYSPYQLVYLHDPPLLTDTKFDPFSYGQRTTEEYMKELKSRFQVIKEITIDQKLRDQRDQKAKQNRYYLKKHIYVKGDLVYYFAPRLSDLQTSSRKFVSSWIGLLTDLEGKQLNLLGGVHIKMIKPCILTRGEMRNNLLVTYSNLYDLLGQIRRPFW